MTGAVFTTGLSSEVEVLRQATTWVTGSMVISWQRVSTLRVRFDLQFVRPGSAQPRPIAAGAKPDRTGLMIAELPAASIVKAGDRVRCLSGPIAGEFEIRNIPDRVVGYSAAHHMEVQVQEVAQSVTGSNVTSALPPTPIRHLYASRVEILRLRSAARDAGSSVESWVRISSVCDPELGVPGEMKCRLDLQLVRPGKDALPVVAAGRAQDRIGVLFCDVHPYLLSGDRVRCLEGPIEGTFELRLAPDLAPDLTQLHHLEVQIVEVAQSMQGMAQFGP